MQKIRVMSIFGTRPEAIKMAPVIKKLGDTPEIEPITVITAQHREMLDQVLDLFQIQPDYDLDIMESGQSLTGITTRVLIGLERVLVETKPDIVLVHGDTSTTFAASLAAYYQKIRVGHIEAGLRTNNKYSPFPEEMNRHLTGVLTDLHFAPTGKSKENLEKENIPGDRIFITGNTVIDALLETVDVDYIFQNEDLKDIDFDSKKVLLLTSHRRENIWEPMRNIFQAALELIRDNPGTELIFPVHLNPEVKKLALSILGGKERIHLILIPWIINPLPI